MISVGDIDIFSLVSDLNHEDIEKIYEFANYPQEHDGKIVFIREIKGSPIEPFTKARKFYFNDRGEWYTLE